MRRIREVLQDDNKRLIESVHGEMDMYYFALFAFSCMERNMRSDCLADLTLVLDKENFFNLINVFGGKNIRIPTTEELNRYIKVVSAYYYVQYEHVHMSTALKKVDAVGDEMVELGVRRLKRVINKVKIPKVPETHE